ncbi:MAG: F0F1 ATP synthase subunit B [Patescibacteria group bacterium]|nr:F0F1 ATP synthase subunit B [Patescibacteria group bacterium]
MENLIETFHIDIKLLIAQIINFAIVFCVLYFFALKPLMKVMRDRTKKIEKSMDDAQKIEKKLSRTDEKYSKAISNAKKEANIIMEKAGAQAEERKKETIAKAKEEIGQIINQEKANMQQEKAKILKEIKREVADLVIVSVEKVLEEKVDSKRDMGFIKRVVKKSSA